MENLNSQPSINVNLKDSEPLVCEQCGGLYFNESLHLRKISGILVGKSQPTIIPIPVFTCIKCGHVNQEFLPKEIKKVDSEDD